MFNAADVLDGAGAVKSTWSALDAIVGGAGNDTFNITSAAAIALPAGATVSGIETVNATSNAGITLNTTSLSDVVALNTNGAATTLTAAATTDVTATATAGTGAGLNVEVSAGGKVTFAANDDTLAEKLIALAADTVDVAVGEAVFFEDGGNTYIFINGNTSDDLIQLTGVTGFTTFTEGTLTLADNFSFA